MCNFFAKKGQKLSKKMFTLQLCWIIQDVLGPASHPIEDERSQKHRSHLLKKRYFPQNITRCQHDYTYSTQKNIASFQKKNIPYTRNVL